MLNEHCLIIEQLALWRQKGTRLSVSMLNEHCLIIEPNYGGTGWSVVYPNGVSMLNEHCLIIELTGPPKMVTRLKCFNAQRALLNHRTVT